MYFCFGSVLVVEKTIGICAKFIFVEAVISAYADIETIEYKVTYANFFGALKCFVSRETIFSCGISVCI